MNSWNHNQAEREMVGYLLGDMPEDKLTNFEERYFADDALFDQMLLVKHELVDAYVRRHLDAETHEKFERHFLATPGGQQEVAFANALREKLNQSQPAPLKTTPSRWSELFGAWSLPEFGLAAAALLLVAIGLGWLAIENRKLSHELSALQTDRANQLRKQEELEQQVAQLKLTAPSPAPLPIVPPLPDAPTQNDDLLAINLHSGDRSGGDENTFELPSGKRRLRLNIKLDFKPLELLCNVTLHTPDGAKIERRKLLARKIQQGGFYVLTDFTTTQLKAGKYEAVATATDDDNKEPVTVQYPFNLKSSGRP